MKSLGEYSAKELGRFEENAKRLLLKGKEQQQNDARDLLAQIAAERINRSTDKLQNSDGLVWDNQNRNHRLCFLNGQIVAEITQDENHTSENDEVYTVHIRGVRYDKRYRHISDARRVVESKLID